MPILSAILKEKKRIVESKSDSGPSRAATASSPNEGDPDTPAEKGSKDILEQGRAGEEHNSSDEEELADDADATETRKKNRQQDQDPEEGLSEEDMELVKGLAEELDDELPDINAARADSEDDGFEDEPMAPAAETPSSEASRSRSASPHFSSASKNTDLGVQRRIQHVTNLLQGKATAVGIVGYDYDTEKSLWCELTLSLDIGKRSLDMSNVVKKASSSAVIKEVKNIKRAFIIKDKGQQVLTTEGVNITEMFKRDQILNLRQLACNNVHEVAK